MIPFLQYRQEAPGTPPVPTGGMELVPGAIWKRTWNDGPVGGALLPLGFSQSWTPSDWTAAADANPSGIQSFHGAFPNFVQVVRTASREGFAERDYDADDENSSDVFDELVATAYGAMGSWSSVSPHDGDLAVGSEIVSNELVDSGANTYHMQVRVYDCKYLIRWAPPFSSRAKIRVIEYDGAGETSIVVEWNGAAGVTIDGIQRCFPEHISVPVTDSMWIADPGGERVLNYTGNYRDVIVQAATSFRNVALPPL